MSTTPPIDRLGLEVLTTADCWSLLAGTPVGRIGFIHGGEPVVLPVTFSVTGRTIVFRTGLGSKMSAAYTGQIVAFEIDGWDAEAHTGWSVLASGRLETVHAKEAVAQFEATHLVPWLSSARDGVWMRIAIEQVSGRRLGGPSMESRAPAG